MGSLNERVKYFSWSKQQANLIAVILQDEASSTKVLNFYNVATNTEEDEIMISEDPI